MSSCLLRERAEADLADIWRYTARQWSAEQADRYYRDIVASFQALAEQPTLGRACDDVRPGYRRHNVGSHVVFYRIEPDHVDVVRILHARRDFRRHLPGA
ncbi:MAG: type II toxin-antitoxin system RelE/ParE family toxin [Terricaulis sp.]